MNKDMPFKRVNCGSWEEFCAAMRQLDGAPIEPIFRGQALVEWPLVAPIARDDYRRVMVARRRGDDQKFSPVGVSRGQLRYFKYLATGLPGTNIDSLSEVDIEALARHHGLCSNLLDWTSSPYIAAFFAFTDALDIANSGRLTTGTLENDVIYSPAEPIAIWRLGVIEELWQDNEFECLTSLSERNYWQKAQRGMFTRLIHQDHREISSYLEARGLIDRLTCFEVSGNQAGKALGDLEAMNITYATLFPDLYGAALQANVGQTWRWLSV